MKHFLLSWELEPLVIAGLALAGFLYWRGWTRLRRRGRGGRILRPWRAWCYAAGLVAIVLALLSPVGAYESLFFHMHMTQHLLLIMVAAPLLWLGAPLLPTLWAFRRPARRRIGRWLRRDHPVHRFFHWLTAAPVALTVFLLTIAVWHIPALYDLAQGRSFWHDLEHAMFLGSALVFWWPVVHPTGGERRLSYGAGVLYLFPAKLEGLALGAALALTDEVWYDAYADVPRLWGLSVLADQQLGGLIMWVFGGLLYIVPLLLLVAMMMKEDEGDLWVPAAARVAERQEASLPAR